MTEQLAGADAVLLTKADLVNPARVEEVRRWVAGVTPGARILERRADVSGMLAAGFAAPTTTPGQADGSKSTAHADTHQTWSLVWPGSVERGELRRLMQGLPDDVVRAKGVARTTGRADTRTLVQVVGRRVELVEDCPWEEAMGASQLVVIVARAPGGDEPDFVTALRRALG